MNISKINRIISLSIISMMLAIPTAEAVPSFSRQIQADCRTCHTQSIHGLNSFGRAFKRNAFHLDEKMKQQLDEQHQQIEQPLTESKREPDCATC